MDTGDFKDNKEPPIEVYGGSVEGHSEGVDVTQTTAEPVYRLYKQRFVGLFALVVLNFVSGFLLVWFGPIANDTAHEFGFTLGQVNWLGSAVNFTFPPASVAAALVCKRWGVRMTCYVGSALFVVSAWVRYAGTARSLSTSGSLGILILGQMLGGSAQAMFQVIGPSFSETWFGLKSRTTVTMIIGVANPFGSAIAQIISPLANTVRTSILVLAIICTCAAPLALLMTEAPPTPPTHSASHERPSLMSLIRALGGRESTGQRSYMTVRERMDFFLLTLIGGVLVGVVTSYSLLTAEHFHPYGYSKSAAGLFGATLIIVGLVMAGVTAPLFDRVLTNHLSLTLKVACPLLGILWLSMIWAVKPHDSGALFAICALIGGLSLPILPVFLELAVEVTRNADGSTACLWSAGNLMTVIFVLSENALRAGPNASPPFNMHRAFILQGALTLAATSLVFGIDGKQTRRKLDEQRIQEAKETKEVIQMPII